MKNKAVFAASIAFVFCAVLCLGPARSQTAQDPQTSTTDNPNSTAATAAAQMAPAQAVLVGDLDARKMQQGQEFHAALSGAVHLKNGIDLPRGTVLVGTIVTDNMQSGGNSTLALRFTQADLKGGKVIPIAATIFGFAPPSAGDTSDLTDTQAPPLPWNGTSLGVDVAGVLSGVDLHSKIADNNSGVFVSAKKDNFKLAANSQFALAIAAQSAGEAGTPGA